jgi:hypothetical protein
MNLMTMAALSLLAGFVAAGFVWFGWGAAENLLAMRRAKSQSGEASSDNEGK